jgi:hypothetical protein
MTTTLAIGGNSATLEPTGDYFICVKRFDSVARTMTGQMSTTTTQVMGRMGFFSCSKSFRANR